MAKQRIRIQGEGSIVEVERGRVYRIRLRIPPAEPGGKRKWSKSRTVRGTKAQARQEMERYRAELEEELNNEHSGLTVGQYAYRFHEERLARAKNGEFSPLSIERDQLEIDRINTLFGNIPITELTTADIKAGYEKLNKRGFSASTVHKTHAKLKQILNVAVVEEVIEKNPCARIQNIKRPKAKDRRSLTVKQAIQLAHDLHEAERNGRVVAVWLALATGVRRGEALGLLWKNVDLRNRRIYIDKQLDSKGVRRNPKSEKSKRNLAIDEGTVRFLTEWKDMQSKLFYEGSEVPGNLPVCTNEHGNFLEPNVFNRWRRDFFAEHGLGSFKEVEHYTDSKGIKRTRKSGYEGFNFHELRHTQATLLIGKGADIKTVQNRLGHSSASLTMDIYAHAIEQNDREAANVIGGLLEL